MKVAEEKLKILTEKLAQHGVNVDDFKKQQKMTEDKIAEMDRVIREDLPQMQKDLIAKYKEEKAEQLRKSSPLNFIEERAEENKSFFKLNSVKEEVSKNERKEFSTIFKR